jgi:hypothetical protein
MDNEITNADIQRLLTENPLAAEQLRRIVAERQRDDALANLTRLNGAASGPVDVGEESLAQPVGWS